jgi:hypothetical protein
LLYPLAPQQRLFVTIPEAARYSGLSMMLLKKLIERGQLKVIPDRPVKIARADLERLSAAKVSLVAAAGELRQAMHARRESAR